jgi:hypothetical protein
MMVMVPPCQKRKATEAADAGATYQNLPRLALVIVLCRLQYKRAKKASSSANEYLVAERGTMLRSSAEAESQLKW